MSEQEQALTVLIQAVQMAQKRGAFDLTEASVISSAVKVFTPPAPPQEEDVEDEESEEAEETEE